MSTPRPEDPTSRAYGNYPGDGMPTERLDPSQSPGYQMQPPSPPPHFPPPAPPFMPSQTPQSHGTNTPVVVILTVLVVAVLALGGVLGWFLWSGSMSDNSSTSQAAQAAAAPPAALPAPAQAAPPIPALPSGSQTCDAVTGSANGYTTSAIGSSVTSCPFAEEVRLAYARSGDRGGSRLISAVSPVTGRAYDMNCVGSAQVVTCAGGENAVVYVY